MDQLLSAISIVSDPTQNRELQAQAIAYLNQVRQSPTESWQLALSLFIDTKADGNRAHDAQIRSFALQILDDLLVFNADVVIDPTTYETIKGAFITYIRQEYVYGSAEASAPFIRNKFSHSLALLFLATYPRQWEDFFSTIYSLLQPTDSSGSAPPSFNLPVSTLFLKLLLEISAEVADAVIKEARTFIAARHHRDAQVRDHIRERDSKGVSEAVLAIIENSEGRLTSIRNGAVAGDKTALEDVIALAVKAFASLIPWVNVNFTVTPSTLPLLFRLLSDPALQIRLATANAFLKMLLKGLKDPADKLTLIRVLALGDVLTDIEARTRGTNQDDDTASFREGLAKLTNGLGCELIKLAEDTALPEDQRQLVQPLLDQALAIALHFLADEYDDTSQAVHSFFTNILSGYKRQRKTSPQTHMTESKQQFLSSFLQISLQKMKWDSEADVIDMDEEDRGAFEGMRKDLRVFMDSLLTIEENLVTSYVQTAVMNTLQAYQQNGAEAVPWQDAELAVFLVYIYGEFQKTGKGRALFVQVPNEIKALQKSGPPAEAKPPVDYLSLPLTPQGELMLALVQSGISKYPHPAVLKQFFEAIGRYGDFFKVRKDCALPVLEAFIDIRGIHTPHTELRARFFYLFNRFIKEIRRELPHDIVLSILNNVGDLLAINAELIEPESPEDDLLDATINKSGSFDSQLYLFEAVGVLLSLLESQRGEQAGFLRALTTPILNDLSTALQTPMISKEDVLPVVKVHHYIRALGNLAKGFPDAPVPTPQGYVAPEFIGVFGQVADAILVSLGHMDAWKVVREAVRFAFSRIIATTGAATTQYIPPLVSRMIASCEADELADFFGFFGLLVHKLQLEIYDVMNELITPLFNHMATVVSAPIDGTDAKVESTQTKRGYLELLLTVMTGPLYVVFLSDRNKPTLEPLFNFVTVVADDSSDPVAQRTAWTLLARFTTHFGRTELTAADVKAPDGTPMPVHNIPGYETFLYERLIPSAFDLPTRPDFNLKDGATASVLGEVGTLLAAAKKARGQEAVDFFALQFLPSKNCPPELIDSFVTALQTQDTRGFKKFWSGFVRGLVAPAKPGA